MYIMAFISGGYIIYTFDYLVMKPAYLCRMEGSSDFISCTSVEICQRLEAKEAIEYQVDWSNPLSLDNWVSQLDLICKKLSLYS
jgi:hypothetical protein